MGLDKGHAVLDQVVNALRRLLSALSGDIASVLNTSQGDPSVALALITKQLILKRVTKRMQVNKYVEKARELVALDLMMAVLQKLQSALSMVTVNVLNINREDQSVDLALVIVWKFLEKATVGRSVVQDLEPAVQEPMKAVLLRLLFALSGDIVNVKLINKVVLNVVLALMTYLNKTKKGLIMLVEILNVILDLMK